MKKLWFKNKTYGWGWTPATREGWTVLALYTVLLVIIMYGVLRDATPAPENIIFAVIACLVSTILLLCVCYRTGEKPEWKWGNKKQ